MPHDDTYRPPDKHKTPKRLTALVKEKATWGYMLARGTVTAPGSSLVCRGNRCQEEATKLQGAFLVGEEVYDRITMRRRTGSSTGLIECMRTCKL